MSQGRRPLLRDPEFLKFWGGQSISLVGSQFTLLALPIAAGITLHATAAQMGALTALQFAPGLLFSVPAGVWLDRARRRPVLIATQVVSALVLATIPVAAALHVLSISLLFAVAFVTGTASVVFGVAQISYLPTLVGRDRLIDANSRYQMSRTVASLVGPGLAGAAVQLLTAPMAMVVDASSFVVGAASVAAIRAGEPTMERRPQPTLGEAVAGLALMWAEPLIRAIAGTLFLANVAAGMSSAIFVLLFVGRLGVSPGLIGVVFAASSLSSLIGSLLIRPLQDRAGIGSAMTSATALVAVGAVIRAAAAFAAPAARFPLLLAGALVAGFGLMIYNIAQQSIRQAVVPDRLLGRTTAGVSLMIYAGSAVAALAGGALGQLIGLRAALIAATILTILCVLPTASSPLRTLRTLPAGPASEPDPAG